MFRTALLRRAALAALVLGLFSGGCAHDLHDVGPGMMFIDVERVMGKPEKVEYGELIDTDKTTWVYPQGRVYFEGCTVVKVELARERPSITERVEQEKGLR